MNILPFEFERFVLREGILLASRFRLVRSIGDGGIGVVWLAEDTQLNDELVACKILRDEYRGRRECVADLKREILLTRKLRHPNILALHAFWETDECVFLTMEFIDGVNLSTALDERGAPFGLSEALPWLIDIAGALDSAHEHGVLHRDVKPANMLLGPHGSVKLGDFGIARSQYSQDEVSGRTTQGTIYFMSPEQIANGPADPRSDLYSLAASAYQLLSGAPPFCEGEVLAQIQVRPPTPIPLLSESVNRELLRALSKAPDKRHSSCLEFVQALECAADSSVVASRRPTGLLRVQSNAPTVILGDYTLETRRTRLGRFLVEGGLVSQEQLAEALLEQRHTGERLGEILIRTGRIDEQGLAMVLSRQLCTSVSRLCDEEIDPVVANLIEPQFASRFHVLPIRRTPYAIVVAMADPLDMEALNALEQALQSSIEPVVATASDIRSAIARRGVIA